MRQGNKIIHCIMLHRLPICHLDIPSWSFQWAVLVFHVVKSSKTGRHVWKDAWFHFVSLIWSTVCAACSWQLAALGEISEWQNSCREALYCSHTHSTFTVKWEAVESKQGELDKMGMQWKWYICIILVLISNFYIHLEMFVFGFFQIGNGRSDL